MGFDDELNPQEGVADDQLEGTQTSSQDSEQTGGGTDSSVFTQVNREALSPELQQRWDEMNKDYTQKTQQLSEKRKEVEADRQFAAVGKLVEQNPVINKVVWDTVNRLRSGEQLTEQPVTRQAQQQSSQESQMTPEEVAGRSMIRDEVLKVFQEVLPQIVSPIQNVTSYMQQNQARTEYDVLTQKYPAAKTILPNELEGVRLQYRKADGSVITMEEAFIMMAGRNPNLLIATPSTPPGTRAGGGKPPLVERGARQGGQGGSFLPGTPGYSKIREAAQKLVDQGAEGVSHAIARARTTFGQKHPNM